MMELAIIASDIQEVLGSATALNILFGLDTRIGVVITILDSFVFLFIHYFGVRKLEGFFAFLIMIMAVTFILNMFKADLDFKAILYGTFVPTIPDGALQSALSLVGAVIMPHNLYLHSSLVLTRKIDSKNLNKVNEASIYNVIESSISLFISFLISSAVIITFGAYTISNPNTDKNIDLESASVAL